MKPGDLVRVRIKRPHWAKLGCDGHTGIIVKPGARGPYDVWWVLMDDGRMQDFQPTSLELISETR
jgi:hypothetical protein